MIPRLRLCWECTRRAAAEHGARRFETAKVREAEQGGDRGDRG